MLDKVIIETGMSERLIICMRCGATIQRNTPGSTGLPVPGLCDGCKETHELEVLSVGLHPAGICRCGKWAWTSTHAHGDTQETKLAMITEAHARHIEEAE